MKTVKNRIELDTRYEIQDAGHGARSTKYTIEGRYEKQTETGFIFKYSI